jgi:hypothetical protein
MFTHRKLVGTVAVAIAAGALGITSAAAASVDLRTPDARDAARPAAVAPLSTDLRSPDAQDLARGIQPQSTAVVDARSPDSVDRATGGGVRATPGVELVQVGGSSGFDWGDAAIGAGGLAALALLGAGIALMEMHRRRAHLKPPSALVH